MVAIAWAGHRDLFSHIRRTDRTLVWLEHRYLLPLCLLLFGASLISRYDTECPRRRDPVLVYAIAFLFAPEAPTATLVIYGAVPVVYFVGITVARGSALPGSASATSRDPAGAGVRPSAPLAWAARSAP